MRLAEASLTVAEQEARRLREEIAGRRTNVERWVRWLELDPPDRPDGLSDEHRRDMIAEESALIQELSGRCGMDHNAWWGRVLETSLSHTEVVAAQQQVVTAQWEVCLTIATTVLPRAG